MSLAVGSAESAEQQRRGKTIVLEGYVGLFASCVYGLGAVACLSRKHFDEAKAGYEDSKDAIKHGRCLRDGIAPPDIRPASPAGP